ncbi:MAG TPA: hypothetical protein VGI99_02100 [Gemmataceae bacterium]|jgi:hypothetical protein
MSANTTYKSLAEGLPPDVARQIHPDWYKNEADYWAVRDSLLPQYENMWVAFANGSVIAFDKRPSKVAQDARKIASHPFMTCVGREEIGLRMRRASFPYDKSYPGEPLPIIRAEFSKTQGSPGIALDSVILDTGSDTSALPWSDCKPLQLDLRQGVPYMVSGVTGASVRTVGFFLWVKLDGQEYECRMQVDFQGTERILGRDVLNYLDVLFRGPAAEVVINP